MNKSAKPNLLNTPQAAEYLTLKEATLESWRCRGMGPRYLKVGGLVRYSVATLDEWVEQQSRSSTAENAIQRDPATNAKPLEMARAAKKAKREGKDAAA